MGSVIGELLPLAVGVAVSPIPIIAVVLMLLSDQAGRASSGFAVGWVVGIFVTAGVFVLAAGAIHRPHGGPSAVASWIKVGLGVLLLVVAAAQWHSRHDTSTPTWMRAIDRFTAGKAAGLGAVLAAVNPKNLLLCVSAGVAIGASGQSAGGKTVALAVFTVIAAVSVLAPVVGYLLAADRVRGELDELKNWLRANNHLVMALVLALMGTIVLGKGIGGL